MDVADLTKLEYVVQILTSKDAILERERLKKDESVIAQTRGGSF